MTSGVPQGSVVGPILFLAYINGISTNIEAKIRLFADDCIIYRNVLNVQDVEKVHADLDRLGEWAELNDMIINPSKSKALSFTRARMKDPLNYSFGGQTISEDNYCKYSKTCLT